MGKRKSSAKAPAKKQRPKLDTTFSCPFCNAGKVFVFSRGGGGLCYHQSNFNTQFHFHSMYLIIPCSLYATEKSVHCELDRERDVGQVRCTLCGEHWEDKINALSEPIDIYSAWIDACENENKGDKEDEKK